MIPGWKGSAKEKTFSLPRLIWHGPLQTHTNFKKWLEGNYNTILTARTRAEFRLEPL
jgi:hypothetical protein